MKNQDQTAFLSPSSHPRSRLQGRSVSENMAYVGVRSKKSHFGVIRGEWGMSTHWGNVHMSQYIIM